MRKRTAAVLAAMVITVCLAGCSSKGKLTASERNTPPPRGPRDGYAAPPPGAGQTQTAPPLGAGSPR
jgi:predicted small lipoprotein YifL